MDDLLKKILKSNNYKATPARLAILEIFLKDKKPLTAEDICIKLGKIKNLRSINEATVYRTLSGFEETGVLRKVDLRKDSAYFELSGEHHHHIICTKCNEVEDFESTEIEKIINRIVGNSSKFKSIKEHSLELFGVCKVCN